MTSSGADDSGFPIVRSDANDDGFRLVGYIGFNELEHALGLSELNTFLFPPLII